MSSYNRVILIGNLTRDPELRYTPKGTSVAKFGLAVNRTWRSETGEKKEECTFVDIDVFGKTAENVSQYMRKGSPLMVEGRLRLDTWDDKTTGQKRSKLGVVAETVQFLGGKNDSTDLKPKSDDDTARRSGLEKPAQEAPSSEDSDEVPF